MFGEYLKKYRIENGLTQNQAATKLNLLGGDLSNIDTVTISRWERGTTKPTLSRSIRVLREFTNDLKPYLSEVSHLHQQELTSKNRIDQFDIMMEEKYHSLNNLIARANYQSASMIEHNAVCECPIKYPNDNDTVNSVLLFHEQTSTSDNHIKHGLSKIDFLNYCEQKRFIAYKYVDSLTGELLGHKVGTIFTPEGIKSEIEMLDQKSIAAIDLRKTVPYNENRKLVYFATSQHSLYERPFRLQLNREFRFLAKHANITDYYTTVAISSSVEILKKMGFSVVSHETKSASGTIKIGKQSYARALMHIETSQLFAQPEFLNLLTNCQNCPNPCSVSSQCC
ncbi:helix-turn-helix domain-containing protein [Vibrio lentus]|uniref:helix-turn-helix domain-containing protein n=1 Tax=Vibrio lentus TaxID=136468 RepID=UPI0007EEBED2|nr:helix-turn-helix transcriptional regulator [Vibrio lentus]OBT22339.1 transcriptional regulator [Vibrio tasmaniensis]PMH13129.1 transcriptional regulator [Vibrio lentus]PMI64057.1 transcriptional regulator [Vibrio lentus]PMJ13181.1 transcriptional regulator [Vibrio lentus]PMN07094.1 transcriptional regulator [Vibrio lentus]